MDMQTIFFTSLLDLSEIEKILILFFFREDVTASKQVFEKNNNEAEQAEVRNYFLENTGIEYKNLVHRYAFNSLSKLLQQDMELLHPEVQYDSSYFNEEEELAKVLEGKTELTQQDIEKLTNLIICSVSWGDQDLIKSRGMNYYGMIFNSYYAGIPLKYFGQLLAKERNLEYKDDKQLIKELSEIKNLRAELRRIVVDSIKNGLFENEYIPLCNSDTYKTYSGKTKQKHNVIFKQWIKAKQKAVVEIQKHIKENDLIFEERKEQIYEFAWTKTIVTGTSLYYADESISFVKEYKEQIEILLSYGMMLRVLEARDISEKYSHLLRYNEVAEKMSKILNEDATYTAEKYLDQIHLLQKV